MDLKLAQYKALTKYVPQVGDFVVWHGWFTHWYGVVNGLSDHTVTIIHAGMPKLLFTMDPDEMTNNTQKIKIGKIRGSKGSYSVLQNGVWYV